jgi:hypothetical protein
MRDDCANSVYKRTFSLSCKTNFPTSSWPVAATASATSATSASDRKLFSHASTSGCVDLSLIAETMAPAWNWLLASENGRLAPPCD